MPFLLPVFAAVGSFIAANAPAIAAVSSVVGTGVSVGETLANQPGGGSPMTTAAATPTAQTPSTTAAQKASVASAAPNIQSASGGSLSPEYWAGMLGTQTGVGADPQGQGNIQAIINQAFGLGAPGQTGLGNSGTSPSGNSITDLLANVRLPSSGSTPGSGIVDAALNSDTFHGFGG